MLVRPVFVLSQWMKSKVGLNKDYNTDIQQSETQNESLPQILVNIKKFFGFFLWINAVSYKINAIFQCINISTPLTGGLNIYFFSD